MKLCLGTVQLGMSYGIVGGEVFARADALKLLREALDHGVKAFDTASAYGDAELILGEFLKEDPEHRIKIISKGISKTDLKQTLEALGRNTINGYLFHDASQLYDKLSVKNLIMLKEAGLTENVGVSIYKPEDAMYAASQPWVDYIQIPYNALDQRLDKVGFFKIAKENGKTIYARSVLLQGLMTMPIEAVENKLSFASEIIKNYIEIVKRFGKTPLEAAIEYVKANNSIDFIVFGVYDFQQMMEFINIFKKDSIDDTLIHELKASFETVSERILSPDQW